MRLYLLLFLFILCSCGTRKKTLDVTTTKSEVSIKKESQKNIKKDIKQVIISDIAIIDIKSDVNTTFEGKISDSTKPAIIKESVLDGVKTTVFTNFKEVKTSDSKVGQKTHIKEDINQSLIDTSNESIQEKEKENKKNEVKIEALDLEREGSNAWIFWLLLALGILGGGYYMYNKAINPLNWF